MSDLLPRPEPRFSVGLWTVGHPQSIRTRLLRAATATTAEAWRRCQRWAITTNTLRIGRTT